MISEVCIMCRLASFARKHYVCSGSLLVVFVCLLVFGGFIVRDTVVPSLGNITSNLLFQNKCIEGLDCFYTGPPFYDPIYRPISLSPSDYLQTKFILFTPANPEVGEEINITKSSVENSSFNSKLPIKVLIHGFRSDLEIGDVRFQTKDALLNGSDYNIIMVDWTENNGPPYAQAVANARAVGVQLANLLKLLMEIKNVRPQNVHIIGHSLGAHIGGWAGEKIDNLGRITGLDAAGPLFRNADNLVRLDVTDALFVDVIHTDSGDNVIEGLGIGDPIGHINFYPNGGCRQPGCIFAADSTSSLGTIINITTKWLSNGCDHNRVADYFLESIDNTKCRFLAVQCENYDDFEKGNCLPENSTVAEMGFHSRKIEGIPLQSKFFLRTNGTAPFCIEDSIHL